jgi:hypothetical protein
MTGRNRILLLCLALAIGAWLRCWHIGGQLLLDDEWHPLFFVPGKGALGVLFGQGSGANSTPVNLWAWLLLKTVGWSEIPLRLPSLLAGIAAVVAIPSLARRVYPGPAAILASFAIAISPVLIFYSRFIRAYAPACLFATTSVLVAALWIRERRSAQLHLAIAAGVAAAWYHPFTAIPVASALLVSVCHACRADSRGGGTTFAGCARGYIVPALLYIVPVALFIGIPILLHPWVNDIFSMGQRPTPATLWDVATICFGTDSAILKIACLGFVLRGWVVLYRSERPLFVVLSVSFACYFLVAALNRADGSNVAIVIVRYGIAYVPLLLFVMCVGVSERLPGRMGNGKMAAWLLSAALLGALYLGGPLRRIFVEPNNFTNHFAYQDGYERIDWSQTRERALSRGVSRIREGDVPRFYKEVRGLRPGGKPVGGLVEYPMFLGDHFNHLYYYQHFHGLPVVGGYLKMAGAEYPQEQDTVFGNYVIDEVLSRKGLRTDWKTMVDIGDIGEMKGRYEHWILVAHKNPLEEVGLGKDAQASMPSEAAAAYDRAFGERVYEDATLACWLIR